MGGRKSKKRVLKKTKAVVAKVFDCPFCNHSRTCEVKIDYKIRRLGTIQCRVCSAKFALPANPLTEAIDVYSAWIDECEAENKPRADDGGEAEFIAPEGEVEGEAGEAEEAEEAVEETFEEAEEDD